jgi:hypothetical protein
MSLEKLIIREIIRKEITRVFQKESQELNQLKLTYGEPNGYPNKLDELTLEQLVNLENALLESLSRLGTIQNEIRSKISRLDMIIQRSKAK